MATIKGQNLRVLLGGRCVAAATSCTLHVAMQTEDSSTKDDDGDFATVNPVGLSWDVSVDALVTDGKFSSGEVKCTDPLINVTGFPWHNMSPISLKDGDVLSVTTSTATAKLAILDASKAALVTGNAGQSVSYTATANTTVYVACSVKTATVKYAAEDAGENAEGIMDMMGNTPVVLRLSYTNGVRNRNETTQILQGNANLTDYSLTAANRQNAVFTAQFEGTGELKLK